MKHALLGAGLALGLGLATAAVAADNTTPPAKGTQVTLTGCVAGSDSDSFVLTNVQTVAPAPGPASSGAVLGATGMEPAADQPIYWLSHDSVKLMRGHVGHKVEVTGTVTDISTGTVKVREEAGHNKVAVEARGKDAIVRSAEPLPAL